MSISWGDWQVQLLSFSPLYLKHHGSQVKSPIRKRIQHIIFIKGKKEDPGNYWLVSLTLVLSKIMGHSTYPWKICPDICRGWHRDGLRQPTRLHQGQIVPDWFGSLLWWTDCIGGKGKSNWCHVPCILQGFWHHILFPNLKRYRYYRWTIWCIRRWLDGCIQRMAAHSSMYKWNH